MKLSGAGENSREKGEKNRFGFLEGLRDLKVEVGPRFVMIVPNRRKETLLPTILERIRPGTTIMSDEWKAYSTLNLHNYVHKTDYEFSDILMHISNYKPVEPHVPKPEPDTEDEETDIPGIDDIFHEESGAEESSGLASEEEKFSDYEP
ncbi:uncharacterized protein MONOS_2209 [Monocercomonoides exilis]|uniref:uncharacterized protein n=1 Tax=Monocercomonoides exilis TaxID=2049356 RepID=UPI00355A915F|nr:hypothetical protein MONOS_2209 [Monocercomonoides exilis]|eukprot:MONOS_2209.1-p1 / transcript=MONOS_2209.1 / gene=MONOS_2209 / organism=Monocercomonoides_exilis_PA203 / gene_product=unspecified product / transcript_product=unspecified product / location=Mono_scaffold00044:48245-48850(+) / protein_length=148 / sequence_SO=supercontig / SO=protein_coding / is_pseudo=false